MPQKDLSAHAVSSGPAAWRAARELKLTRTGPFGADELLEPDVNFFVLALEASGAKTIASCAGHPEGLYIKFSAPYVIARQVADAGGFIVELDCGRPDCWTLRLPKALGGGTTEADKQMSLECIAAAWLLVGLTPELKH